MQKRPSHSKALLHPPRISPNKVTPPVRQVNACQEVGNAGLCVFDPIDTRIEAEVLLGGEIIVEKRFVG